jgi:hypothetical protein
MAHKLNYSQATMQAKLNAITTAVGSAGTLEIRDGTQPAGPDTTAVGTLGATFTMASPFASAASAAIPSVLSPTLPSNVNASNTITPTWFRIKTSGATAIIDGSAGASACDMTIGGLTSGQPVSITSFTITSGDCLH